MGSIPMCGNVFLLSIDAPCGGGAPGYQRKGGVRLVREDTSNGLFRATGRTHHLDVKQLKDLMARDGTR